MPTYEQQADLAAASGADEAERERANYTPYKPTCTCPSGQSGHPHASWCASEWRNDGMEHEMTQAQRCERCKGLGVRFAKISSNKECLATNAVGCEACNGTGRTQEPSVDVIRTWYPILNGVSFMGIGNNTDTDWANCNDGFVTRPDHDAALSSLRTELVAARAEIERLKANDNRRIEIGNELQAEIATLRAENEKLKADNSEAISTMTSYYDRIQRLEEANRVLLHRLDAKPGNPFPWGEVFRRHLAKGEDHGSAAYAADRAEARANQGRGK